MMHIELKIGESVKIGEAIVSLDDKSGRTARLSIDADKTVLIRRVQHNDEEKIQQNHRRVSNFC